MGEIVYDLMESLRAHLQSKMIDSVPDEYEEALTYIDSGDVEQVFVPSLIKVGRLQDDPTSLSATAAIPSVSVTIQANDPEDLSDGWKHTVASSVDSSSTNLSLHIGYPYEVGGTKRWWRRIRVLFSAYFIDSDQTQDEAARLANLLRGLLEKYCESRRPDNLNGWDCVMTDVFGESALESHVAKSHCWEGGGPDDDYIWRGGVWIQVMTERE